MDDLTIRLVSLGMALLCILIFERVFYEWKYAPWACRLRCKLLGHDYHDGAAQNLSVERNGEKFRYDFCQRCHTSSEYRPE